MNVFGYIRVSGKGQLMGDGPERQAEKIGGFCGTHGLSLGRIFSEDGISGTVEAMDRPAFAEMLQAAQDPNGKLFPIHAIVVERLDRLARDLMVSEFLLAECRKRDIKVYAADQGQLIDMATNEGDPTRKLIRQILGALAEWEKSMLVSKLGIARSRIRQKTGRCEGAKPYGELPGETHILQLAKNLKFSSSFPMEPGAIAKLLNDGGFKTRFGKPWTRHSVRNILKP